MENRARKSSREEFSAFRSHNSVSVICPACGTAAARAAARFCSVCGKILTEDYEPLDRLRASYRLQGKSFGFEKIPNQKNQKPEIVNLFEENKNSASDAACAFVVYSLVPYLGILFCPLALLTRRLRRFHGVSQALPGRRANVRLQHRFEHDYFRRSDSPLVAFVFNSRIGKEHIVQRKSEQNEQDLQDNSER